MAQVGRKIKYYTPRRNGRGFWEPPKWAREKGFSSVACGPDGPDAWALAEKWNKKLEAARRGEETDIKRLKQVHGSLGHWYYTWKIQPDFKVKKPATRADIEAAWHHIEPVYGNTLMEEITSQAMMQFHMQLDVNTTPRTRWNTMRRLRQILIAATKYKVIDTAPEFLLPNSPPAPRTQLWYPQELEMLMDKAEEMALPEIRLVIWILNETAFSPVDARTITMSMIGLDHKGRYVQRDRIKTDKNAQVPITDKLWTAIQNYVDSLEIEIPNDTPFLRRTSTGKAWKDRQEMARDFRKVRETVFGKEEKRVLLDIRRSVSFMSDLGGATPEERGALLANNIGKDSKLDETYSPSNVIKARATNKKRETGEEIMRQLYVQDRTK